jgi:ribosome-interacting GTPase 1
MPTNLPPEYAKAEERHKAAGTIPEKIETLEEMISIVPKHKGTDKLRADLRKRLSKLKASAHSKKGVSRHVSAFHISREGAAQIAVIGAANVGKSSLVAALTNASPEVADYPFSTWTPTAGMLDALGIPIQLIDTPPLDGEYVDSELLDLIRRVDLILLVVDLQTYPEEQLADTVAILREHRISPERYQGNLSDGERMLYKPLLVVANKCDDEACDEVFALLQELLEEEWPMIPFSANQGRGMERLKKRVLDRLDIIRVYAKPPGKEADLDEPFALRRGATVEDLAGIVHKDFVEGLKWARIWGSGSFEGQMVSRDYELQDGDIVELHL